MTGRHEGGREGSEDGGATKDGASTDMPRDASDGRVSGLVISIFVFLPSSPSYQTGTPHSSPCSKKKVSFVDIEASCQERSRHASAVFNAVGS